MGLTGIVTEATMRLHPVESAQIVCDTERATDVFDCMERMTARDDDYRYSVAWIDCTARGKSMGRGILGRGDHATLDALPKAKRANPRRFVPQPLAVAPSIMPSGLINLQTTRAFNEVWFRKARKRHIGVQSISAFFHPLDLVDGWNRAYGSRGCIQYQYVVPFGAEDTVRYSLEMLSGTGMPSFLAVLKRLGDANPGLLSFPAPGWTRAVDIPVGPPELPRLLDRLDDAVLEAGGRVYLAKDARTRPDRLGIMYPRLAQWREIRAKLDPDRVITSDMARRLGLDDPIPETA
jgi:decaprenylphospho-beta-D-ribofuranose 2-oxidase